MAKLESIAIPVEIQLDVVEARRLVRRLLADAKQLNRELAQVEAAIARQETNLTAHFERIREQGIRLEADNG